MRKTIRLARRFAVDVNQIKNIPENAMQMSNKWSDLRRVVIVGTTRKRMWL
jgi:hypothetical protein